jgi:hypothetical protein
MNRFFAGLAVGIVGTVLVGAGVFFLMPVQAHGLSKGEQAIFDYTKLQCKDGAKAKSLGVLERRKYVANCVLEGLNGHPDMDPLDVD